MKYFIIFLKVTWIISLSFFMVYCAFCFNHEIIDFSFNSDGLYAVDIAHDILRGEPLGGWNLSHATYLFPDVFFALIALCLVGWSVPKTMIFTGLLMYLLTMITGYLFIKQIKGMEKTSLIKTVTIVSLAILLLLCIFPNYALPLYDGLFRVNSHCAAILISLLALIVSYHIKSSKYKLSFIMFFIALATISDITIFVIILGYLATNIILSYFHKSSKDWWSIIVTFAATLTGVIIYKHLPNGVFSQLHYVVIIKWSFLLAFIKWVFSSWLNVIFMLLLLFASIFISIQGLLKNEYNSKNFNLATLGPSSLLIILLASFMAGIGDQNQRYFAFPGIILLYMLSALILKLLQRANKKLRALIMSFIICFIFLSAPFIFAGKLASYAIFPLKEIYTSNNLSAESSYNVGKEKVFCIRGAAKKYPLQDGVAEYWDARQIKFFSNFNYYIAQIAPYVLLNHGYFYWINNKNDFYYRDTKLTIPRNYNYIFAKNQDINKWGEVLKHSTDHYTCQNYTVYYYNDPKVLWKLLFN